MTDYDHGAYTPPGDRLAFDPREPVRSGPAPVTLIASGLILLSLVGGVAFVYRHGFRQPGAAPAEVGAPVAEIKTPAPADTTTGAPAGLSVEKTNAAPTFAAGPEQPLPRGPEVAIAPMPPPAAATPTPPVAPAAATPVAAPAAKPAPKPLTIASLTDAAMAPKPAVKAAAKPPAPAAVAEAGANWVQIGAFSSTALAQRGWSDVADAIPGDMKGRGRKVEAVAAGGKTLYRAYVTGFTSHSAAETFCGDLKALRKSCIVK